jgi:Fic family protein
MADIIQSPAIKALLDEIDMIQNEQEPTRQKIAELEKSLREGEQRIERNRAAIALLEGKGMLTARSRARASRRSGGQRLTAAERAEQALDAIRKGATNAKQVAEAMGVSTATATKSVDMLLSSGRVKATGQRAGRRLSAA